VFIEQKLRILVTSHTVKKQTNPLDPFAALGLDKLEAYHFT